MTEPHPARFFCFRRKKRDDVRVQADTICDTTGYGTSFVLKSGGKTVGEVQGDIVAWWIEPADQTGKTYCLEMNDGQVLRIVADHSNHVAGDEVRDRREFTLEGQVVGTVYDPQYHTWWIETTGDDASERSGRVQLKDTRLDGRR